MSLEAGKVEKGVEGCEQKGKKQQEAARSRSQETVKEHVSFEEYALRRRR